MLSAPRQRGLALALMAGVLALIALSAATLGVLLGSLQAQMAVQRTSTQARLLARSGMAYAAARLTQEPRPVPGDAGSRFLDWTYREGRGASLEAAWNPSYAVSEPFTDVDGNGKYDPGEPFDDWNGNGRFDRWSGRLRTGDELAGSTFSLKILGESAKISVNGGLPGDLDRYNATGASDPLDEGVRNAGTYWDLPEHGRIVDLLDTLAEVLGREPVGKRILEARPYGGYLNLEQVSKPAGLAAGEWPLFRDYLSLATGGEAQPVAIWRSAQDFAGESGDLRTDRRRPVALDAADAVLLEAMSRHLTAPGTWPAANYARRHIPSRPMADHLAGGSIQPEDAARLAGFLETHPPFASRYAFYRELDANKVWLFLSAIDQQGRAAAVALESGKSGRFVAPPTFLDIQNTMTDLVFANFNPDPVDVRDTHRGGVRIHRSVPPLSLLSYDLLRPANPDAPLRVPRDLDAPNVWKHRASGGAGAWSREGEVRSRVPFGSWELSLDPEILFGAESRGRIADMKGRMRAALSVSGVIRTAEQIVARTQDDFDGVSEGKPCGPIGGVTRLKRGLKTAWVEDRDRVQTYPMFPRSSCSDLEILFQDDFRRGSPYCGDLRLMDYSSGSPRTSEGCVFYAPMWETDQPNRPLDLYPAEGWIRNFQDLVGKASADTENWLSSGAGEGLPLSQAARHHLRSGTTGANLDPGHPYKGVGPVPPGTLFPRGRYVWSEHLPVENRGKRFPMVDPKDGTVLQGTIEFWSGECESFQSNPLNVKLSVSDRVQCSHLTSHDEKIARADLVLLAPGFYSQPDWHHVALAFNAGDGVAPPIGLPVPVARTPGSVTLYVDGLPVAASAFVAVPALDPGVPQRWSTRPPEEAPGGVAPDAAFRIAPQDELRFYTRERIPASILTDALESRYWTKDSDPAPVTVKGRTPQYVSPLYRFDAGRAVLAYARYEGFVPRKIVDAVLELSGLSPGVPPPLDVELHCYENPEGAGAPWKVPFPDAAWRDGGGGYAFADLWREAHPFDPMPRFQSFRFRVALDSSALSLQGLVNTESPVFDAFTVRFRTGVSLSGWREQ